MNMNALKEGRFKVRFGPALVACGVLLGTFTLSGADLAPRSPEPRSINPAAVTTNSIAGPAPQELAARWGIEVKALRLSANGNLIDFRYRVTDPEKAAIMGSAKIRPVLIDLDSGAQLHVPSMPKVGQLRSTTQRLVAGKIYTALFANPTGAVKKGHKVTIVFGDCRAENLTVDE